MCQNYKFLNLGTFRNLDPYTVQSEYADVYSRKESHDKKYSACVMERVIS